jgi:hypothetical protein
VHYILIVDHVVNVGCAHTEESIHVQQTDEGAILIAK